MATLPAALLNALNIVAPASSASDKNKNVGDGFQALLELGVSDASSSAAEKVRQENGLKDDGRDAAVTYTEVPKEITGVIEPLKNDREDIAVYVSREEPEDIGNDAIDTIQDPAEVSDTQNLADSKDSSVSQASAKADIVSAQAQDNLPSDVPTIEKLANAIATFLTNATFMANQGGANQAGDLVGLEEKLRSLSPDMLARLQSVLQDIQQVLQGVDKLSGSDKASIASVFGQIISTLNKPVSESKKTVDIEKLLGRLQAFADLIAKQSTDNTVIAPSAENAELTADNDNVEKQSLLKPALFGSQNSTGAVLNADNAVVQQNTGKPDQVGGVGIATQVVARSEVSSSGSGFSDLAGGQRDNSALMVGLARPAGQSNVPQTGNATFSRILQQTAQQPVLDQVIFHVKAAVDGGNSKIHIQLHPAELGKLDIKLEVDADGKTGITVTADNKGTLDLLQRDSRGLERALADAGLKADSGSLSFNLRSDGQDRGQQDQAVLNYKQAMPEEEPLALDLLTRSYVVNLADGLDIKI